MTEGWIPAFAGMTEEESGMTEEDFTPTLTPCSNFLYYTGQALSPQGGKQY